jgi:hypothetical protein
MCKAFAPRDASGGDCSYCFAPLLWDDEGDEETGVNVTSNHCPVTLDDPARHTSSAPSLEKPVRDTGSVIPPAGGCAGHQEGEVEGAERLLGELGVRAWGGEEVGARGCSSLPTPRTCRLM